MKDTIIKKTGNSRFLRSSVAEDITFAEFITLLRAGQLPIDLAGINEEGIETLGMALNKENLLNEETEMIIWGNVADRTPTAALKYISETFRAAIETKIVTGTYTGNDAASRTISLGFTPKAVFVMRKSELGYLGITNYWRSSGSTFTQIGLALNGSAFSATDSRPIITVSEGGFIVYHSSADNISVTTNSKKVVYHYIAFA